MHFAFPFPMLVLHHAFLRPSSSSLSRLCGTSALVKHRTHMSTVVESPMAYSRSDVEAFGEHLQASNRILALCGAGLSASSGLPTFRGAGGYWRTYDAMSLATPEAFHKDPSLVWQFYSYRRHMALKAQPNRAHFALAELARRKPNFLTISQNVDGRRVTNLLLAGL